MFTAVVGLTVLMGAGGMPSDPERLSGAEPGVDPDPPSELEEGPISVTTCPARPLSTDLQRRGHLRSRSIQPLPADAEQVLHLRRCPLASLSLDLLS